MVEGRIFIIKMPCTVCKNGPTRVQYDPVAAKYMYLCKACFKDLFIVIDGKYVYKKVLEKQLKKAFFENVETTQ